MPPVLGWGRPFANDVGPEALLLFLIIFAWDAAALLGARAAIARRTTRRQGLPMLPGRRTGRSTRGLQIVLLNDSRS
jgi:protoheme IX farnesyltransferase